MSSKLSENGLNITSDALAKYEREDREPRLETWQKLANFFGVSVPYIQGIEPDYTKPSKKTDKKINDILNNSYFENEKYDDVNGWVLLNLRSCIVAFIRHSKLDTKELHQNESNKIFWKKYFNFVFMNEKVIKQANKVIAGQGKNSELIITIMDSISFKDEEKYRNTFSEHLLDKYRKDIYGSSVFLTDTLNNSISLVDVNNAFDDCIKNLNEIRTNIENDIKSGNFENEILEEQVLDNQPIKYTEQAKKLYQENDDFKKFCQKSNYIAIVTSYNDYLNMKGKKIGELSNYIENNPILRKKYKDK